MINENDFAAGLRSYYQVSVFCAVIIENYEQQ